MAIFKKKESEEESYVEVDESKSNANGVNVKIDKLRDFSDVERVQNMVRDGNIVFLNIKELRQKDVNELKRTVERLKKTIVANNGDIVGVDEDFLVLTPSFAKVFR